MTLLDNDQASVFVSSTGNGAATVFVESGLITWQTKSTADVHFTSFTFISAKITSINARDLERERKRERRKHRHSEV